MNKHEDARCPECPACRAAHGRSFTLIKVGERLCEQSIIGADEFHYFCSKCRVYWVDSLDGSPIWQTRASPREP